MKRLISISSILLCLFFCSCDKPEPAPTNQPKYPDEWSPAGHVYVYETTWESSPADDNYWVWVLDFISEDSVIWYETYERNLSTENADVCTRTTYRLTYPKLLLHLDTGRELTFIDTLTINADIWGFDYTILR